MSNKIVVESLVRTTVEDIWEKTQNPENHIKWDIRFDSITYLKDDGDDDFSKLKYVTTVGFGMKIEGEGKYLHNEKFKQSTFEFWSDDPKSLIKHGKGIWLYKQEGEKVYFKTVFDYSVKYGSLGRLIDRIFRPMFCYATEFSFENLRSWCEGRKPSNELSKSYLSFVRQFLALYFFGRSPNERSYSWLGKGGPIESRILNSDKAEQIILFDGVCNLCHGLVQFTLKYDRNEKFHFASLQSEAGAEILKKYGISNDLDTFVYVRNGVAYTKSSAGLFTLRDLGGMWKLVFPLILVPKFFRDLFYNLIAKNRYKVFGKKDTCYLPSKNVTHRFLD